MNRETIRKINGIIMVSSKEVAKVVGIQNNHVVEDVDQWLEDNKFHWREDESEELFVLASPKHPINGRKCRAYWISRNGIKHLKVQNDKYFKARDLYFELLDMELGKVSDDTFETQTAKETEAKCATLKINEVIKNKKPIVVVQSPEPQRPIEDDLKNENGQIVVSSRMVAERFGKRHDNVLRDIEELSKTIDLKIEGYFILNNYTASNGKSNKEYLMNRDGFTLLAMGFTGKEALKFKLAYIEAFNKMEEALKKQTPQLPTTYKDALIALVAEVEQRERLEIEMKAKEEVIQEMTPKVEYHNAVLNRDDLITTTDIAKDLGMSATKLNSILIDNKVLYRKYPKDPLKPYANYQWLITDGYADYKVYPQKGSKQNLQWTEKGRQFLIEFVAKLGY